MHWAQVSTGVTLWLRQQFTNPRRRPPYFSSIINKFPLKDLLFPPTEELRGNIPPFRDGSWKDQQCFCPVLCRLQEFMCRLPSSPSYPALPQDCLIAGALHHAPARSRLEPCSFREGREHLLQKRSRSWCMYAMTARRVRQGRKGEYD